jgi:hypothetical protein
MSKKRQKQKPWKWKKIPYNQRDKFTDIMKVLKPIPSNTYVLATGGLDPEHLTLKDHKKHSALYFRLDFERDDLQLLLDKKFRDNVHMKELYEKVQNFARQKYSEYLDENTMVSGEIMGLQNRPFNKMIDSYKYSIILHGSLCAQVPKKLWTRNGLEELCEKTMSEGFIILDYKTGERCKLKREYFASLDLNSDRQRGAHVRSPSEYTEEGLLLCGGDGLGYENAALNVGNQKTEIMSMVIQEQEVKLFAMPIIDTIIGQLECSYEGQKMMNFFQTEGQGIIYKYTDEFYKPDSLNHVLEFQIKHDGETALIHKDESGVVHLMAKLQIDVYELEKKDGTFEYRLGWF